MTSIHVTLIFEGFYFFTGFFLKLIVKCFAMRVGIVFSINEVFL